MATRKTRGVEEGKGEREREREGESEGARRKIKEKQREREKKTEREGGRVTHAQAHLMARSWRPSGRPTTPVTLSLK